MDARPRVAGLRPGGDRADLDEAEAERAEALEPGRVLVHAGRDAQRTGEGQPERVDAEARVRPPAQQRGRAGHGGEEPERRGGEPVGLLGVEAREDMREEAAVEHGRRR